jgi:hypothetical protein
VRAKGIENLFSLIIENLSNLAKNMHIQVQEAFRIINRHEQERIIPCHIIVEMPNVYNKVRILRTVKVKSPQKKL